MFLKTLSNGNVVLTIRALFALAMIAIFIAACAPYQARKKTFHYHATGDASWYGPGFHGRRTASGERYNQKALTAAHRTLPIGSSVMVTNIDNGKSVIVRINDRGPFIRGRIIDLSRAAAEHIGMRRAGTARVELATQATEGEPQSESLPSSEDDRF